MIELLDSQVFSGSVDRGSCWRFLGSFVGFPDPGHEDATVLGPWPGSVSFPKGTRHTAHEWAGVSGHGHPESSKSKTCQGFQQKPRKMQFERIFVGLKISFKLEGF